MKEEGEIGGLCHKMWHEWNGTYGYQTSVQTIFLEREDGSLEKAKLRALVIKRYYRSRKVQAEYWEGYGHRYVGELDMSGVVAVHVKYQSRNYKSTTIL